MAQVRRAIPGSTVSGTKWHTAELTTALTGTNNDLTYTAKARGAGANAVSVTYVDPGDASQALSVSVTGNAITVNLATDGDSAITSTAAQVRDAVNGDSAASALVTAANATGNNGTGVVTALSATTLAGGKTETTGTGGSITVRTFKGLAGNA